MPRRRQTTPLVPLGPSHRRLWRTLWRRCSCGLPTPCVDRRLPSPPPPFPRRDGSGVRVDPAQPELYAGFDVWRSWGPDAATRAAPLLGRPLTPYLMRRDDR